MKSIFFPLFILSLSLSCTGCFEVLEAIDVNPNGSGDLSLKINMSESKETINNYARMTSLTGGKVPSMQELQDQMQEIKQTIAGVKGISNVNVVSNVNDYIFNISCNFSDIGALNNAINTMGKLFSPKDKPAPGDQVNFVFQPKQFTRNFSPEFKTGSYDNANMMVKYVMDHARFVSVTRFGQNVKNYTNKAAQLSPDKKTVTINTSLADLAKGIKTLENTVKF